MTWCHMYLWTNFHSDHHTLGCEKHGKPYGDKCGTSVCDEPEDDVVWSSHCGSTCHL